VGTILGIAFGLVLPVFAMTTWLAYRVRRRGLLDGDGASGAPSEKAIAKAAKGERWTALLTRYGAGFYGIAALWTLVVVELRDLWAIVLDPGPFLELLSRGPNAWFGAFVRAQVEAITTAFTWFFYWGDEFYVAALIAGYFAWRAGMRLGVSVG